MAPAAGFEPATNWLTANCSTTELRWNVVKKLTYKYASRVDRSNDQHARQRPTLAGEKPQLPSALESLTSVFGMGTGVASLPSPPDMFNLLTSDKLYYINLQAKMQVENQYNLKYVPSKLDKKQYIIK